MYGSPAMGTSKGAAGTARRAAFSARDCVQKCVLRLLRKGPVGVPVQRIGTHLQIAELQRLGLDVRQRGQGTEQQDLRTDSFLGKSKNPKVRTPNCIEAVGVRRPLERDRSRGLHYVQDKGQRKARTP